jgi:hypothetical protein
MTAFKFLLFALTLLLLVCCLKAVYVPPRRRDRGGFYP